MEWFIGIIIPIVAALIFGIATKKAGKKINLWWFLLVLIISFFLTGFMPLLISIWCGLAVYIYCTKDYWGEPKALAIVAFIVMGIIFILAYPFIPATVQTVETGSINLVALRGAVASSGTFYLGCGSVDGTFYYIYGYMQGPEFIQGLIQKTPKVHVYPNRMDGGGRITSYKSYYYRDTSSFPINLLFNGAPEKTDNDYWTEITIPPDSIMQEIKI
ncbi:MAG: hypothetical protein WC468_03720 [Candidatus Paceibacterota bacterium]